MHFLCHKYFFIARQRRRKNYYAINKKRYKKNLSAKTFMPCYHGKFIA